MKFQWECSRWSRENSASEQQEQNSSSGGNEEKRQHIYQVKLLILKRLLGFLNVARDGSLFFHCCAQAHVARSVFIEKLKTTYIRYKINSAKHTKKCFLCLPHMHKLWREVLLVRKQRDRQIASSVSTLICYRASGVGAQRRCAAKTSTESQCRRCRRRPQLPGLLPLLPLLLAPRPIGGLRLQQRRRPSLRLRLRSRRPARSPRRSKRAPHRCCQGNAEVGVVCV